jgi:hypothetical protein
VWGKKGWLGWEVVAPRRVCQRPGKGLKTTTGPCHRPRNATMVTIRSVWKAGQPKRHGGIDTAAHPRSRCHRYADAAVVKRPSRRLERASHTFDATSYIFPPRGFWVYRCNKQSCPLSHPPSFKIYNRPSNPTLPKHEDLSSNIPDSSHTSAAKPTCLQ